MVIRDLRVTIDREWVFHQIDCHKDSEIYEEVAEEYRQIEEQMYALCEPVLLMQYGAVDDETAAALSLPGDTPLLFVISTVGGKISDFSTRAFQEGEYLKGMLADAMADSALSSLERQTLPHLKELCAMYHVGIEKRLDAPKDIPMTAQKLIFERTQAGKLCGMKLSSGYMLDPVKSGAMIYVLTRDTDKFNYQHDCRKCGRLDCKMRSVPDVPVEVVESALSPHSQAGEGLSESPAPEKALSADSSSSTFTLYIRDRQSLMEALTGKDPSFSAVCGGRGSCGKCQVQVLAGSLPVTEADRRLFTQEQLSAGFRLACQAYPQEPLRVALKFQRETSFSAVSDYMPVPPGEENAPVSAVDSALGNAVGSAFDNASGNAVGSAFGIAVDIGTTTIALQLLSLENGKRTTDSTLRELSLCPIKTHTLLNRQRSFGADVISRILASTQGKGQELCQCIRQDLSDAAERLLADAGIFPDALKEIVLSGNTTMIHLLMKYDCSGLGVFPFTPVNIGMIQGSCGDILGNASLNARVRIIPSVSAFVGGDIVAGMYHCGMHRGSECRLLIDLGTNGELALCGHGRMIASSTAAGPAFEGGNIAWGTGSVPGAICHVTLTEGQALVRTIGDLPPTGICGTGALEILAELVRTGLVDETGYLDDAYGENGFPLAKTADGQQIVFTQRDIRELQLAKSALRSGIETLCLRFGITPGEISRVYLAGGFGLKLDCDRAISIGLLPACLAGKITAVGNASLAGAASLLLSESGWMDAARIAGDTQEIPLASDPDFNRLYVEHMYFEPPVS